MLGWIIWERQGKGRIERCTVCGVPFYRLEMPPPRMFWQRKRLRRRVLALRKRGVYQVVVQGAGPDHMLWEGGVRAIDPAPLRLVLLPKLLAYVQEEWQLPLRTAAVRLRAGSADETTCKAAQMLAQQARYLVLALETGQAELETLLRRRCGLGMGGGRAVLEVCIGVESSGSLPALHLGKDCAARQKIGLFYPEADWADEQLLAALFQAGKLKTDEIRIKSVGFRA